MKPLLLFFAALTASASAGDEILPVSFGRDRYEAMVTKSPFALATPPETPKAPVVGPFDNTFIKGIGTGFVVVQRLGDDQPMRFWDSEPNHEQVFVKEVKWSTKPGGTTVILKQGEYEKEIGFNENELRAPASQRPPQPNSKLQPQPKFMAPPVASGQKIQMLKK